MVARVAIPMHALWFHCFLVAIVLSLLMAFKSQLQRCCSHCLLLSSSLFLSSALAKASTAAKNLSENAMTAELGLQLQGYLTLCIHCSQVTEANCANLAFDVLQVHLSGIQKAIANQKVPVGNQMALLRRFVLERVKLDKHKESIELIELRIPGDAGDEAPSIATCAFNLTCPRLRDLEIAVEEGYALFVELALGKCLGIVVNRDGATEDVLLEWASAIFAYVKQEMFDGLEAFAQYRKIVMIGCRFVFALLHPVPNFEGCSKSDVDAVMRCGVGDPYVVLQAAATGRSKILAEKYATYAVYAVVEKSLAPKLKSLTEAVANHKGDAMDAVARSLPDLEKNLRRGATNELHQVVQANLQDRIAVVQSHREHPEDIEQQKPLPEGVSLIGFAETCLRDVHLYFKVAVDINVEAKSNIDSGKSMLERTIAHIEGKEKRQSLLQAASAFHAEGPGAFQELANSVEACKAHRLGNESVQSLIPAVGTLLTWFAAHLGESKDETLFEEEGEEEKENKKEDEAMDYSGVGKSLIELFKPDDEKLVAQIDALSSKLAVLAAGEALLKWWTGLERNESGAVAFGESQHNASLGLISKLERALAKQENSKSDDLGGSKDYGIAVSSLSGILAQVRSENDKLQVERVKKHRDALASAVEKLKQLAGGAPAGTLWKSDLAEDATIQDVVNRAQTTIFKIDGMELHKTTQAVQSLIAKLQKSLGDAGADIGSDEDLQSASLLVQTAAATKMEALLLMVMGRKDEKRASTLQSQFGLMDADPKQGELKIDCFGHVHSAIWSSATTCLSNADWDLPVPTPRPEHFLLLLIFACYMSPCTHTCLA